MDADVLVQAVPAATTRLLADVWALDTTVDEGREPALDRLEDALGRDFADRLVAALTEDPGKGYRGPG